MQGVRLSTRGSVDRALAPRARNAQMARGMPKLEATASLIPIETPGLPSVLVVSPRAVLHGEKAVWL